MIKVIWYCRRCNAFIREADYSVEPTDTLFPQEEYCDDCKKKIDVFRERQREEQRRFYNGEDI